MNTNRWAYYTVASFLVLFYFLGESTGYLFFAILIILPVGYWVLGKIFGSNN